MSGSEGSDPQGVAEAALEAGTDRDDKLRYPTDNSAASLIFLSWLLRDNWLPLVMVERHATKDTS